MRVNPNELKKIENLLDEGYLIGKKVRTLKRKVKKDGEIRYILEAKIDSYLKRGWTIVH